MAVQMARPQKHPERDVSYFRRRVPADPRPVPGDEPSFGGPEASNM